MRNSSRKTTPTIDGYTPRSVQRVLTRSKQALVRLNDIEGYLMDIGKVIYLNTDDEYMMMSTLKCVHDAQKQMSELYTRFATKQTILTNRQVLDDVRAAENSAQS